MNILLTGGLGYIGSHTASILSSQGHEIVLLDNLSNSDIQVLGSLKKSRASHLFFMKVMFEIGNYSILF